jgi:hypothetical protein
MRRSSDIYKEIQGLSVQQRMGIGAVYGVLLVVLLLAAFISIKSDIEK